MMLTIFNRQADFWRYQLNLMYIRYFGWQFIGTGTHIDYQDRIVEIISTRGLYGIPFMVGAWGAIHHFFRDWRRALAVFVLFIMTGYAIIIYLNQPDPQPRERDYSYVGSFFAFALWIGVGMAGILEWISEGMKNRTVLRKVVFAIVTITLFALVPARILAFNYDTHDRTGEYVASDYSYNILQTCEPDAIIFTNGDNDTFPLWYLQEVEGIRKDVRVVNLSLLNTSWYIYQLRDQEPRVPLHMTDRDIDRVDYMPWQSTEIEIPVPQDIQEREMLKYLHADPSLPDSRKKYALIGKDRDLPVIKDKIVFKLDPTYPENKPIVLRVQDLMILRILYDNKWERPVYFAVTVANNNMLNMDNYLRMDGLAFKIMPYTVNDRVDADTLRKNIVEDYRYRGLNDPSVSFNTNIIKLLGNYRSAFMKLSQTYNMQGDREKAIETIRLMDEKIPPEVIPYPSELTAMYINNVAQNLDMKIDIQERTRMVIPNRLMSKQERRETANFYAFGYQMYDRAEEILKELVEEDPNDMRTQSELYAVYKQSGKYQEALEFLEGWLERNPDDPSAQREIEEVRRLVQEGSSQESVPDVIP
jgi:tetratricopeptide (TPR) repeat protein